MKRTLTLALLLILNIFSYAQQTVKRTNYIANAIMERFTVLKSDKKIRDGEFTATFKDVTVAKGSYKNGTRTGSWDFFNTKGKLVQTYNYSQKKLTFLDTGDTRGLKYFMENVNPGDSVTAPVKIGGSCYGLLPLVYRDELSQQVRADNPGLQKAEYTHVITIDAQGNIISHVVSVKIKGNVKKYPLDDSHLDAYVVHFLPATLNHKPVPCQITTITYGNFYGAVVKEF